MTENLWAALLMFATGVFYTLSYPNTSIYLHRNLFFRGFEQKSMANYKTMTMAGTKATPSDYLEHRRILSGISAANEPAENLRTEKMVNPESIHICRSGRRDCTRNPPASRGDIQVLFFFRPGNTSMTKRARSHFLFRKRPSFG